jgi:hypothetical protein
MDKMSRSIHDTHGVAFREWLKARATGSELDWHRAKTARRNVATQRRLKKLVRQRRRGSDPAVPVDVTATPIVERDAGTHVRHPASAEDLREILRRLPRRPEGLGRIELCLGGAGRGKRSEVDPYTGSPGHELVPGVFAPEVRGHYRERSGALRLHAYVYAGEPAPFIAMYLRLRVLVTFVHELAHHHDFAFRIQGDRWRMDDRKKTESFARRLGFEYATSCVLPYLAERYPAEHAALVDWIALHAGIALPLDLLVDDRESDEGYDASMVDHGFCELVRECAAGDPTSGRIGLAICLHLAGHDAYSETMARALLAGDPDDRNGLLLCATIAARRGEFEPAEAMLGRLRLRNPEDATAWHELALVLRAQSAWERLADLASDEIIRGGKLELTALHHRARASIMLGRWDTVTGDIATLRERGARRSAEAFLAWMLCRRGQARDALAGAHRVLMLGDLDPELKPEMAAIRFECAQQIGDRHAAWALSEGHLARLRARGHGGWVAELLSQGAMPDGVPAHNGDRTP